MLVKFCVKFMNVWNYIFSKLLKVMELSEQLVKLKGDLDFYDVLDVLVCMHTTVHIK